MASISVQIRPDKKKKDGSCPIVFRLYHHRNYFYSSGYAVHDKFWDKEKELVKAAHPLASNLNRYIQGRLLAINKYIVDSETTQIEINPDVIRQIISGKNQQSFFTFADKHMQRVVQVNYSTYVKEKSLRNKIGGLTGDLLLQQITPAFLEELKLKLSNIPNNQNTVAKAIKYMRMIYNMAVKESMINPC